MEGKTHERWREALHAYRDGELGAPERAEVEAHMGACAGCRAALARWERLAGALLKAPAGEASEAFVGRVMAGIAEEEAARAPAGFGWWLAPAFALAAGLAVLLWPGTAGLSSEQLLLSEAPAWAFESSEPQADDVLSLVFEEAE